jgi:hypothetical protein
MGWGDIHYCFAMAILVIILLPLSFFFSFFLPSKVAYLVPLDVDVVPINFHQFLFGE